MAGVVVEVVVVVVQELDCTECRGKFSFSMSFERDGNYRIICPHCAHEHFRAVRDGRITEDRWASSSVKWDRIMAEKVAAAPKPRRPRRVRTIRRPGSPLPTINYTGPTPLLVGGTLQVPNGLTINGTMGPVSINATAAGLTAATGTVWSTSGATTSTSATTGII